MATDPIAPEPCRFSIRLPCALWIGVAALVLVVGDVGAEEPWKEIARWERNSAEPSLVAVSRHGKMVAAYEKGTVIQLWNTSAQNFPRELVEDYSIDTLQFSPDGKILATTSGRSLRLTHQRVGGRVRFWNTETGAKLHDFEFDLGVNDAGFMPGGTRMVVATGLVVEVVDVASRKRIGTLSQDWKRPDKSLVHEVIPLSTDDEIALLSGQEVHFWNVGTLTEKRSTYFDRGRGRSFAVAPDGKEFATCSVNGVAEGKRPTTLLQTWHARTGIGKDRIEIDGSHGNVTFSPDGSLICAVGESHETHTWASQTLEYKGKVEGAYGPIGFSTDGSYFVSVTANRGIGVWRVSQKNRM